MGELVSDLVVEIVAGIIVAVFVGGIGIVGWLVTRADARQRARIERIYERLDALEKRAADHDVATATLTLKVEQLARDHRRLLGDDDGD